MVDLYDLYVQKFDEISIFRINCILKKNYIGPSSVVQWLRLCLPLQGVDSVPGWERKVPNTTQNSQIKKKKDIIYKMLIVL